MKNLIINGCVVVLLTACGGGVENAKPTDGMLSTTVEDKASSAYLGDCLGAVGDAQIIDTVDRDEWGVVGLDTQAMDKRFHAGDDFFCHVNGLWYANFEMPEDKTRYGSFTLLRDKSEARVKTIIEELAQAQPSPATLEGKVAAYYNAYMDTASIEAAGLKPIESYLQQINAIKNLDGLAKVFATTGFSSPVGGWVDVDSKDTENYIFYVTQSGLGLPDRDTYLTDKGKNAETRDGYLNYLTVLLGEAGYADAGAAASRVLALETEIAKAHWDRTVGRNRNLTYNKMTRAELIGLGGDFPVATMLEAFNLADQENFVVRQVNPDASEIESLGLT